MVSSLYFFFNHPPTSEIYTLSLHDALPIFEKQLGFELPKLLDYEVRIPPGGKTDALVETTIKWEGGLRTKGVHSDQLAAAIQATEHAMNLLALRGSGRAGSKPIPVARPVRSSRRR